MIVRWLLKNMNGSSVEAEKLRRYPLTWRIMGSVFSSIPLFSLAKSLADRRFVAILQNALKDASEPEKGQDTEMVDADDDGDDRPLKRKRSDPVLFDLESQRRLSGCLRTAEAMFEALRLLVSRLESETENHMGAEHIKSLFCSSAEEAKGLIVPALSICSLAVDNADQRESLEGQENWISTINDIWDLHLQGDGDAVHVATHFSNPAINILGRLTGVPHEWPLGVDSEVESRWTQDLKRFLTRALILPARTAFLNREVLEIIRIAIEKTMMFSTLACPVIFDLVLSAPHMAGGQSARRENDSWTQAVFSLLEETLQPSKSQYKLAAVRVMMDKALKWDVSLSRESLRAFAKSYALQSDKPEWSLLLLTAKLNVDAFIAGDDEELLTAVLDVPKAADSFSDGNVTEAADFIVTLADGYARARDLSGFVQKWFQYLSSVEPHLSSEPPQYQLWYNEKLCKTVAEHLEKTMNTKQILSLLDWLDTQEDGPAQNAALVLILGALSPGITQDDVVDAVGLRLHETTSKRSLPFDVNDEVLANKWTVARRSIEWATYEQSQQIWTNLATDVERTLKAPLKHISIVEAFKFAASAMLANYHGGAQEDQISSIIITALDRIHTSRQTKKWSDLLYPERLEALVDFCGVGCPRLLR
jgi:nucleolar pre-ribosomal-associated protein 2